MSQPYISTLPFGRAPFEDEHEAYRESISFLHKNVTPRLKRCKKVGSFAADLSRVAGKADRPYPGIPTQYGGGGADLQHQHQVILHEEYFYLPDRVLLDFGLSTDFSFYCFFNNGTGGQRRELLPKMARGEEIIGISISDPDFGSYVQVTNTWAVRDGKYYIMNGISEIMRGLIARSMMSMLYTDLRSIDGGLKRRLPMLILGGGELARLTGKTAMVMGGMGEMIVL